MNEVTPAVGIKVTECGYSDRRVGTIQSVSKSGKTIVYTHDTAKHIDGHPRQSEQQTWETTENKEGAERTARLNSKGEFRLPGGGSRVLVGIEEHYYDYSF